MKQGKRAIIIGASSGIGLEVTKILMEQGWTVTVAYLAIVDEPIAVTGQDDAAKAQWYPINALPPLIFDHEDIMRDVIRKYKFCISQGL